MKINKNFILLWWRVFSNQLVTIFDLIYLARRTNFTNSRPDLTERLEKYKDKILFEKFKITIGYGKFDRPLFSLHHI